MPGARDRQLRPVAQPTGSLKAYFSMACGRPMLGLAPHRTCHHSGCRACMPHTAPHPCHTFLGCAGAIWRLLGGREGSGRGPGAAAHAGRGGQAQSVAANCRACQAASHAQASLRTLLHHAPRLVLFPVRLPCPQVNRSLAAEREAKKAAEKDRALVQIVLDAKQRLADAMREVRAVGCAAQRWPALQCVAEVYMLVRWLLLLLLSPAAAWWGALVIGMPAAVPHSGFQEAAAAAKALAAERAISAETEELQHKLAEVGACAHVWV